MQVADHIGRDCFDHGGGVTSDQSFEATGMAADYCAGKVAENWAAAGCLQPPHHIHAAATNRGAASPACSTMESRIYYGTSVLSIVEPEDP
jgi:hypothetical protein